jgi:XTP/dITP diphosphohydrolase
MHDQRYDRILFVSSNEEKYREIRGALAECQLDVTRIDLDLPEIQAIDPAQVAIYKAQRGYEALASDATAPFLVLVEDTGLGITAWNGYPGALIKWVLNAVGEAGLCRQLDAWDNRHVLATVVLCLYDGQTPHVFAGQTDGTITMEPRGEHGFGWDSIFQPEGYDVTYGEMRREEKMKISMRAQAVDALKQYLLSRSGS